MKQQITANFQNLHSVVIFGVGVEGEGEPIQESKAIKKFNRQPEGKTSRQKTKPSDFFKGKKVDFSSLKKT